jgi:hypothetical protein
MPDLGYTHQRFLAAVVILATHHGRINERLYAAYDEAVRQVRRIDGIEDLELALDIEVFHRWMTEQTRAGNRGSAILAMSEDEASEAARELVGLEGRIRVELQVQRSRARQARAASSGAGAGARSPETRFDPSPSDADRVRGSRSDPPIDPAQDRGHDALPSRKQPSLRLSPTSIDLRDAVQEDRESDRLSRSD